MARKKISELTALESASLDTVVVGVDNGVTYKIELDTLADGVANRINTLDIQRLNALENYTASFTVSVDFSELNSFTQSQDATNTAFTNAISGRLTTASFNEYTASISTASLIDRLNAIESTTSSYLISLDGAISSSLQLTSSFDERYTLSGSVQPLPTGLISSSTQISEFGFISSSHTDISALNSFTASQSTLNTAFTNGINARLQTSSFNEYTASLNTSFPEKTIGSWSVPAGASIQSFTVDWNHTYVMWVRGNIPNGIISWNATVNVTNSNVPIVGNQFAWYYVDGNALVLTSIPDQIVGINGSIISVPSSYAPNTSNTFAFGITNNSGVTQTINWGYIKIS